MKISIKRFLVGVVTLALLGVFGVTAFAADTTDSGTGNVTINGSISALTLSISHPINVAYAISPDVGTFTSPDLDVTNNTKVEVNLSIFRCVKNITYNTQPNINKKQEYISKIL